MNSALFSIAKDTNYPRLNILTLQQSALENFVELTTSLNIQDIEYIPFLRYYLSDCLANAAKEPQLQFILTSILADRKQGALLIRAADARFGQDELGLKLSTAIAHLIGHANIDVLSGKYFAKFVLTDAENTPSKLFSPYTNFTMHTDGAFFDEPTDWVMLTKLAEINSTGGESKLLHLEDWEDFDKYYQHEFSTHPFLFQPPSSTDPRQVKWGNHRQLEEIKRPLFYLNDTGKICFRFVDQFIMPETREQAQYLRLLASSLEKSQNVHETPLPSGSILLLNNTFWIHGRKRFQPHKELYREMIRIRGKFYQT